MTMLQPPRYVGVPLALCSMLCYTLYFMFAKLIPGSALTIHFGAFLLALAFYCTIKVHDGINSYEHIKMDWIWLVIKALAGNNFLIIIVASGYADLSDCIALTKTSPFWTLLINLLLTKKAPGKLEIGMCIPAVAGAVFIARPSFIFGDDADVYESRWIGLVLSLICALVEAVCIISGGKVAGVFSFWSFEVANYSSCTMGPLLFGLARGQDMRVDHIPCSHRYIVILCAIIIVLGDLGFVFSCRVENSNVISIVSCLMPAVSLPFEVLILKKTDIRWTSIVGITLTVFATVALSVKGIIVSKKKQHLKDRAKSDATLIDNIALN